MGWDREMQKALQADAEKLSAMTGEDHSVEFFDFEDNECWMAWRQYNNGGKHAPCGEPE